MTGEKEGGNFFSFFSFFKPYDTIMGGRGGGEALRQGVGLGQQMKCLYVFMAGVVIRYKVYIHNEVMKKRKEI